MARVVVFDLEGPVAHFRKIYTNSSSLTYGFPPRTALMGIVAAILGWERDSYYERLSPELAGFAVSLRVPVRRLVQTINYVRTKMEDLPRLRRLEPVSSTQVPLEILLPASPRGHLCFRVYFAPREAGLAEEVADLLAAGRCGFPLYLGLTEFIAHASLVATLEIRQAEVIPPGTVVAVNTVIRADLVASITFGVGGWEQRLVREKMPFSFGAGRELAAPKPFIYDEACAEIAASFKCRAYRLTYGSMTQTVVFMEGDLHD